MFADNKYTNTNDNKNADTTANDNDNADDDMQCAGRSALLHDESSFRARCKSTETRQGFARRGRNAGKDTGGGKRIIVHECQVVIACLRRNRKLPATPRAPLIPAAQTAPIRYRQTADAHTAAARRGQ
mgnify:CR=1 FL=1